MTDPRIPNFSAGPATLPDAVLEQVRDELLSWHGTGMSIMEVSHRDKDFMGVAAEAEASVRRVMGVPAGYKVLFLQGGATAQFSQVPLNLFGKNPRADYLVTGDWGKKAAKEAKRYGAVNIAANAEGSKFTTIPPRDTWTLDPEAAYVHTTSNETIHGVQFPETPDVNGVPIVSDMSSDIASRPLDISKYGLIYAGAQKNLGPAGLTLVIAREDLLGAPLPGCPGVWDYKAQADNDSMLNTPPTFAWYVVGLTFQWIEAQGGLEAIARANAEKATLLYDAIDNSGGFYANPVDKPYRSVMNVPFVLADAGLDAEFLKGTKDGRLNGLKGHRAVGGMRASLYNAMPKAGVEALVAYMKEFARTRG